MASAPVLRGQLDRLVALIDLPNVRIGVVALGARLPVVVMHAFSIRDDTVTVELGHTELVSDDPADLALYGRLLDRLWSVALEGADARALLTRVAVGLAGDERAGQ